MSTSIDFMGISAVFSLCCFEFVRCHKIMNYSSLANIATLHLNMMSRAEPHPGDKKEYFDRIHL